MKRQVDYVDDVIWMPQPGSQTAFMSCPYKEVLYEGTRGPGKTDALIMDFLQEVGKGHGSAYRGILFRESFPQLSDVISRTKKYYTRLYPDAKFLGSNGVIKWIFPEGEELLFRHIKRADDYWNYHGHEYPWIGWEELTNWATIECYDSMKACNRCSIEGVPIKYRSTCNPWGIGHSWVKRYFIDPAPPMTKIYNESGQIRMRIHGHISENRILLKADPDYMRNLESIDDPHKKKAWLDGSWDIAAGGFFEGIWDPTKHIIKPFPIPKTWQYIIGFDWGSQKPGSLGIWARSDGSVLPDGRSFPRGSLIRVNEWYIAQKDRNGITIPDKGLRLDNEALAKGIYERVKDLNIAQWIADPAIFKDQSGPSIQKQFNKIVKLPFTPADNERITGWQSVIRLMSEAKKDVPESAGLWVFDTCRDWIRTVPVLMRDERNVEDIDTTSEDHIADETRYVCQTNIAPLRVSPLII
jgi:hypothetical protein